MHRQPAASGQLWLKKMQPVLALTGTISIGFGGNLSRNLSTGVKQFGFSVNGDLLSTVLNIEGRSHDSKDKPCKKQTAIAVCFLHGILSFIESEGLSH